MYNNIVLSSDEIFEIRNVELKTSKKGKNYSVIRFENKDGQSLEMYYPNNDTDKFIKGDLVNITFNYNLISKSVYINGIEMV